ncbi:XRE family transcriptional regulator [Ramlibacter tataouinensis]|uniref:XRE family transcriptional regulator n=1 Tax=Ramlibacter tataouinensis TaxID=94132 RepID=UPI0022F3C688|nr:XRE family transcriptional regulator [Ramlibacter tataouinensis]WBY00671.1 XRE family transcriptional regulator [Ramlibacter tataouinensis]
MQLASLVGVSPATISKWRSGQQDPEAEALERLATVVNVTPEWFTRKISPPLSTPLFRSNASAHVAARAMLGQRLEWGQELAAILEEYVDYPDVLLPHREFKNPEEITSEEIERAACECRDLWGLGRAAIPDLALAVEGAGVILLREETGIAQIEGLSAWSAVLNRPFILLSADKDNGFRSRFDLAHELGHLILHKHITDPTDSDRHKLLERQAHQFAGAFLLPAETFASDVRTPVTLDDLLLLKRRWGVSVAAMMMRLRALSILSDEAAQVLFKRRSARWGAKSEPFDGDRRPEQPRLLRRTLDLLIESGVLTLESIPRQIGISARDVQMLAGLPDGYLEGKDNVVQLASLRQRSEAPTGVSGAQRQGTVVPFRPKQS